MNPNTQQSSKPSQNQKLGTQLAQSEQAFRLMVDSVIDYAIFKLSPEGIIITWNKGAERIKGYKAEEIIGKHFSIFYTEEDLKSKKPARELEIAIREGKYEEEGWRLKKDGSPFWVNVVITALFENGVLEGFAKVTRDLTERRLSDDKLKEAYSDLEKRIEERTRDLQITNNHLLESNKELEQFAYVASHDLQEPLRKIINYSDRLTTLMTEEIPKDYITRIHNSALRMKTVIEDLLQYSRISKYERESFETICLNQLLTDIQSDLEIMITESNAQISIEDSCNILGNRSQIRHLFQNLITNAIKFSKKGQTPVITIKCAKRPQGIEIAVADNGIGFDPQYAEKIFSPFQRLHRKEEYEGTGIGLAIVQRIVQNHNGRIVARSQVNQGATFILSLPLEGQALPN